MNRRRFALLAVALLAWSAPAMAQLPDWVNQILAAAQLPVVASEARREGLGDSDVRSILDALLKSDVPAYQATAIIDSTRAAHRDHGPADNFGAFVQSQLAAGKRGRELAAAIRQEHARQGKGKAKAGRGNSGRGDLNRGRGRPPTK